MIPARCSISKLFESQCCRGQDFPEWTLGSNEVAGSEFVPSAILSLYQPSPEVVWFRRCCDGQMGSVRAGATGGIRPGAMVLPSVASWRNVRVIDGCKSACSYPSAVSLCHPRVSGGGVGRGGSTLVSSLAGRLSGEGSQRGVSCAPRCVPVTTASPTRSDPSTLLASSAFTANSDRWRLGGDL